MKRIHILLLGLVTMLAGCTTTVVVEGTNPTPRVRQMDANVGVYYDENFKNFQHTEALEAEGTWKINLGDQNYTFFQNLITSMFANVRELEGPEPTAVEAEGLDAVIVPRIEKFGFLTPGLSGLNFFSASIHYRVTMVDSEGNQLADWTKVGYGKSEGGAFGADDALGEATMQAIRDGGARFAIEFPQEPKVAEFVAQEAGDED